jgi:DNA processing protein
MHPAELRELLLLRALPGIGDLRFAELMGAYGSPAAALRAPAALGRAAVAALRSRPLRDRIERSAEAIERDGIDVVTVVDDAYPAVLRQLYDPPGVLFVRGDLSLAGGASVAIVGSRRATPYGRDATRLLATGLARAGYAIVSGLARGIDREAHEAALDCGGRTIAVVGCGIDVVYPHGHEALQERIAAEGLLLSEFLPGEPPRSHHFPKRNRLIAALARGVLVVEAAANSGAMRTVDSALELGRDVFAVPGPIGRETSEGTNQLIQAGATLVTSVPDVLTELRSGGGGGDHASEVEAAPVGEAGARAKGRRAGRPHGRRDVAVEAGLAVGGGRSRRRPALGAGGIASSSSDAVIAALGYETLHVDAVAAATGLPSAAALSALLELELDGRVVRLPGMRYACR